MCKIIKRQIDTMNFNDTMGKIVFIREIAISPTRYIISTITLYVILESKI